MQQSSLQLGTCSLIAAMFRYSEVAAVASIYGKYKKAAHLHARIELLETALAQKLSSVALVWLGASDTCN